MRTLNRPMFNMGGPIKQGIMTGIREPKKHGGKMLLVGQHPKEFQDKSGREHHVVPAGWAIGAGLARVLPWAARGAKAAWRYMKPTSVPTTYLKKAQSTLPIGMRGTIGSRTTVTPRSKWDISKDWMKTNPGYTATGLLSAYNAPSTYEGIKSVGKKVALQAADLAVPDWIWDQDKYLADKKARETVSAVPLNPNLQGTIKAAKELSKKKTKEFALKQREDRVQKYLKMMGYDRAKKTAIADALIDASKIVGDRGSLDPKNITQELINPIIQATSKRLDKPDQIREAVGLMATKAEIEKDLEDPSIKALRLEQLKGLRGSFAKDIGDFILSARGEKVKPKALERVARARAQEHGLDFKVVTEEDMVGAGGKDADLETIIQSVVKDDGVYMIGDAIIEVTDGVPKHIG